MTQKFTIGFRSPKDIVIFRMDGNSGGLDSTLKNAAICSKETGLLVRLFFNGIKFYVRHDSPIDLYHKIYTEAMESELYTKFGVKDGDRKAELRRDIFGKKYWAILEYRTWTTSYSNEPLFGWGTFEGGADDMYGTNWHSEWKYIGSKPYVEGQPTGTNIDQTSAPAIKKTWWRVLLWGGNGPFSPWNNNLSPQ